jgi:hypothetical protein
MAQSTGVGRGHGSGGKRPGSGRPFGSTNRRSRELIIDAERNGLLTPVEYLLGLMRDVTQPTRDRTAAAIAAAPYLHPKLVARYVVQKVIDPDTLSDSELLESISYLEKKIAEAEARDAGLPRLAEPPQGAVPPRPVPMLRRPGDQPVPQPNGRVLEWDPTTATLKPVH